MNYPVWEVSFGSGLLIAIVSIVHVFVSHFAVGGGLFLVVTEMRAARTRNAGLMEWLERHSRFFVLLTVVFGAVSGVGIWFTIGLVHPSGTSALIRSFVWGWAIEWVFFFVEITAALIYLYGWKRMDRRTHLQVGWIYFIAAFMSLVVINGIITFMFTPGSWLETRSFWDGILNPTYFPSLLFRSAIAFSLAGIYALLTGSLQRDPALKGEVVRWSGWWILPGMAACAAAAAWYVAAVPGDTWAAARGRMPTATLHADLILWWTGAVFVLSLGAMVWPRRVHPVWSLLVLAASFCAMGSFEFIREAIRKPDLIGGYMYANAILHQPEEGDDGLSLENLDEQGALSQTRWARHREVTAENLLEAGKELFIFQCAACHTHCGYRGLKAPLREKKWDYTKLVNRLGILEKMHGRVMPPFAGIEAEKEALAAFLAHQYGLASGPGGEESTAPDPAQAADLDGAELFAWHCGDCHENDPEDPLFTGMRDKTAAEIADMIGRLDEVSEDMDPFEGTDAERAAIARRLEILIKELTK